MNPLKPLLQILKDRSARKAERKDRAPFAELERQTAIAASRLAQQGIAKRAAKVADTTAALHRAIDAGAIVPLDQPLPAERLAAAMKGLGIKRVRQHG